MLDGMQIEAVHLFTTPCYSEGVVFDHKGFGYLSEGARIVRFTVDGKHETFATPGRPNGHKILADGTHVVCDGSQHAMIHLDVDGTMLDPFATECEGKALRGPNDVTLDVPNGGFYFTDPGGSNLDNPIGTVHYVNSQGVTYLVDEGGLGFPNGIVLTPDGKTLYLAESLSNRILAYEVKAPGKVGSRTVFAELPAKDPELGQINNLPDGICLDVNGNLFVAHYGMRQVQVLSPKGELLVTLASGNLTTSNVAFGGPNMDQLFVTGGIGKEEGEGGLFRLDVGVRGLTILPPSE